MRSYPAGTFCVLVAPTSSYDSVAVVYCDTQPEAVQVLSMSVTPEPPALPQLFTKPLGIDRPYQRQIQAADKPLVQLRLQAVELLLIVLGRRKLTIVMVLIDHRSSCMDAN